MTTWSEQYVDGAVERAWRELRMELAERFEFWLAEGDLEPVDFTTPEGDKVTTCFDDEQVVLVAGKEVFATENVDEAAYWVCRQLREEWGVIHPAFVDSEVLEPSEVEMDRVPAVPVLGYADSRETLQSWVESTLAEGLSHELRVQPNGDISWSTRTGSPVVVSVRDQHWIEVWVVVASQVSFGKARAMVQRLAKRHPAVVFKLDQDRLVASRVLDAGPYVPRHLVDALSFQLHLADQLNWVQEKVLRKRARVERTRTVPEALLALLPSANRVPTRVLADELAQAGSDAELREWKALCRRRWLQARRRAHGEADPHRLLHREVSGWSRLARAIDRALEQSGSREAA